MQNVTVCPHYSNEKKKKKTFSICCFNMASVHPMKVVDIAHTTLAWTARPCLPRPCTLLYPPLSLINPVLPLPPQDRHKTPSPISLPPAFNQPSYYTLEMSTLQKLLMTMLFSVINCKFLFSLLYLFFSDRVSPCYPG